MTSKLFRGLNIYNLVHNFEAIFSEQHNLHTDDKFCDLSFCDTSGGIQVLWPEEMLHMAAFLHANIKTIFRDRNTPFYINIDLKTLEIQNG